MIGRGIGAPLGGGNVCWLRQSTWMLMWLLPLTMHCDLASDGNDAMLSMFSKSPSTESNSKA